jgi:signal peptidase I
MFDFLLTRKKKLINNAKALLKMANKVLVYRCDILADTVKETIITQHDDLKNYLKTPKEAFELKGLSQRIECLEISLKTYGGKIYPMGFWAENVEMIVVAAILAIGFRTYFFQPFKIPTNSMYPSYYGMTETIYHQPDDRPSMIESALRWVLLGAEHYEVLAPASGELIIPLNLGKKSGLITYEVVSGRALLGLVSEPVREYTFWINGQPATLKVPFEYDLSDVLLKRYFNSEQSYENLLEMALKQGKIRPNKSGGYWWFTGVFLKEGAPILDFDLLSGDRLFVDRVTFHFRRPQVGDTLVFYTRKIEKLKASDGTPDDRFYIKRCVGLPGDLLEIRPPVLYRNGEPIHGSSAFDGNAHQLGLYPGYVNRWDLDVGCVLRVPDKGYYGMGDNSPASLDSRYFGVVPEKEVMGRAIFIYYPFTSRWGISD